MRQLTLPFLQGIARAVMVWTGPHGATMRGPSRKTAPATCAAPGLARCPE
ncbi:MAG: hypothetical protein MUE83_17485 [Tabrizicola sp.]|nr:hypothetical protein [Tabrizicola sp.]